MSRLLNCLPLAIALLGMTFAPLHAASGVGGLLAGGLAQQAELRQVRLAEKEAQRKRLDQEAKQMMAETERLAALHRTLSARIADLQPRMVAHNREKPDPTNFNAVHAYNQKAEGLNAEKAGLEAETRSYDAARQRLQERARDFQRRVDEFQARWK